MRTALFSLCFIPHVLSEGCRCSLFSFLLTPCTNNIFIATTTTNVQFWQDDEKDPSKYKWCKCFFEAPPGTQDFYFMHFDTRETRYEEPNESYWIWDATSQTVHSSGLQKPAKPVQMSSEPDAEYQGYNPKIHGNYDPNAPYAKFHQIQEAEYNVASGLASSDALLDPSATGYGNVAAFNRFSGSFQSGEKSTDRHTDFNKSGRQLNAFFDVDAAANVHDGRSLKEERRAQKLTKKEIQEMRKKRREKKENKRLEFYKT